MRELGITLEHKAADHIIVKQDMVRHPKKLILIATKEDRHLDLTYDQAWDLKDQLVDFLGDYEPGS